MVQSLGMSLDAAVIIVCSRPASLRRCLASLAAARDPRPLEVLAVLNGRDAACAAAAGEFARALPELRVLRGGPRSLGGARNLAMAEARAGWLCFLDDDVAVPPDYFSELEAAIRRHPEACAIGGAARTPPGSPLFERCVGHSLGSWLGAGRFRRRTAGYAADTWTDDSGLILCNLALRRSALESRGFAFDEELVRNEENLLLQRLFREGGRALHAGGLFVFHERRSCLRDFCRQCCLSGKGRAEMTFKLPGALSVFHVLPLLPAACLAGGWVLPGLLLPAAGAYAAAAALNGLRLRRVHSERSAAAFFWLWLLAPAGHVSYAAGLAAGAWSGLLRSRRRCAPAGSWKPIPWKSISTACASRS